MAPNSKEVEGYVGFANLPNQGYRKAVKRGFEYTLMVVGKLKRKKNVSKTSREYEAQSEKASSE